MNFRTQVPILKHNHQIDYNSNIVSLGSCFAVNIADKLDYFKFNNAVNPFGILFHPQALEQFAEFAIHDKLFSEADIFFHNERWHCFNAHSELSAADKSDLLKSLNSAVQSAKIQILRSTHVIITLGTAWVYRNNKSGDIVANCHKLPQVQFRKELLSIEAIATSIQNIMLLIQSINPTAQLIWTVSPVRHIKDGFAENQRSKAHLIAALHQTLKPEHRKLNNSYFPSYEIMMDELRDYRFYAEDMLHPNQTAINYIWDRFCETWVSADVFSTMTKVDSIRKALAHKPLNPESDSYKKFNAKIKSDISEIKERISDATF